MRTKRKPSKAIDLIAQVEGARWTKTGLTLSIVNDATLRAAGLALQNTERCRAWWWGDFLVAYCTHALTKERERIKQEAAIDGTFREKFHITYTHKFADIAGVEPGTLRHWRAMAEFYPREKRRADIPWAIYYEAWHGAGSDFENAWGWIKRATQNKWTGVSLRAAIRTHRMQATGAIEEQPILRGMKELVSFSRWSRMEINRLADLDIDEMVLIRRELEPAEQLIAALDAELKTPQAVVATEVKNL